MEKTDSFNSYDCIDNSKNGGGFNEIYVESSTRITGNFNWEFFVAGDKIK